MNESVVNHGLVQPYEEKDCYDDNWWKFYESNRKTYPTEHYPFELSDRDKQRNAITLSRQNDTASPVRRNRSMSPVRRNRSMSPVRNYPVSPTYVPVSPDYQPNSPSRNRSDSPCQQSRPVSPPVHRSMSPVRRHRWSPLPYNYVPVSPMSPVSPVYSPGYESS